MELYKKIIKSQKLRFKILDILSWVPDVIIIKIEYWIKFKRKLNLKNPQRFSEYIQMYKLYYRNETIKKCVDKYEVRKFVESKGLKSILNECYGVYNNEEEIDFNVLPKKFIIKTTNGGGGINNIICKNKKDLNISEINKKLSFWLKCNSKKSYGREWAYNNNKNRIIIEKLLEGNDEGLDGINDYKFFCYNGIVKYVVFDGDRYTCHRRNFYDENWNYLDIICDCETFGDIIKKPKRFNEMKEIAKHLSSEFPFVRVDLYCIKDKIYFGELTFYPWSGYVQFQPDSFDYELGKFFKC